MPNSDLQRILWPVDPFSGESRLHRATARAIRALAESTGAAVEPVYVFSGYPEDFPSPVSIRKVEAKIQSGARAAFEKLFRNARIPNLQPLKLLSVPWSASRSESEVVIDYAKKTQADLIAVGTRARKGIPRLVMGSFAESLMLRSDIPLFVINPESPARPRLRHVIFCTDFSPASRDAYESVLRMTRILGGGITLYHQLEFQSTPALQTAFRVDRIYRDVFERMIEERRAEALRWAEEARQRGIPAEVALDKRRGGSTADAILAYERRHPGVIAMAGHTGPVASALLGSVTRKVVRGAHAPVWVVHPEGARKAGAGFKRLGSTAV